MQYTNFGDKGQVGSPIALGAMTFGQVTPGW